MTEENTNRTIDRAGPMHFMLQRHSLQRSCCCNSDPKLTAAAATQSHEDKYGEEERQKGTQQNCVSEHQRGKERACPGID
jgi:hypothetical protein